MRLFGVYHKLSKDHQGIILAILVCFLVSVMISIVRYLSKDMHFTQIVMMRNFFSLFFMLPIVIRDISKFLKTKEIKMHIIRGLNGLFAMLLWFYAVTIIPLSEAVSISFIVPIVTTLLAMLFLKEKISKKIWISLFVGFAGVLIIVRPGFKEFTHGYFFALLAPILWSFSNILVKKMVETEKPETIAIYLSFVMLIFSIPIAAPYLNPVSWKELLWLAILGIVSNLSYISISVCYSKTRLAVIQPFDFTRLIFVSIIAYIFFGEIIDFWTIMGSLVILFGTIYLNLPRKRIRKRKPMIQDTMGVDV